MARELEHGESFQPSMFSTERPLLEHLISSLKVLGKFSLGAVICGGGVWLAGNAFIDSLTQPILVTLSSLSPKEMVGGFAGFAALAGGLTVATYFSSSHN